MCPGLCCGSIESAGDQLNLDLLEAEKEESVVVVSLLVVLRNVLLLLFNLGADQRGFSVTLTLHNSFWD